MRRLDSLRQLVTSRIKLVMSWRLLDLQSRDKNIIKLNFAKIILKEINTFLSTTDNVGRRTIFSVGRLSFETPGSS